MVESSKVGSRFLRSSYRDLIFLQYRMNSTARVQLRLLGRTVFVALIIVSAFFHFDLTGNRILATYQLVVVLVAALLFGFIWRVEDKRLSEMLIYIDEIIARDASIRSQDDEEFNDPYIRGRYRLYGEFSSQIVRVEPLLWLTALSAILCLHMIIMSRAAGK